MTIKKIKKLITITGLFIFLGCLGGAGFFAYQKGLITLPNNEDIQPAKVKITNISQDRFTISWITQKSSKGSVVYGTDTKLEQSQLDDSDQLTGQNQEHLLHHITITNLKPATKYYVEIRSGDKNKSFNDNGKPYEIKTASTLSTPPQTDLISGVVSLPNGKPAVGSIVYTSIAGIQDLSTQVKKDGSWLISLGNARNTQLTEYASYDPQTTVVEITVQGENTISKVTTNTAYDSPVGVITLGESHDFTKDIADLDKQNNSLPIQAPVEPDTKNSSNSAERQSEAYPLEPIKPKAAEVTLQNPAKEKEELHSTKPEFIGTGPANKVLTIEIHSTQAITGTAIVDKKGNWTFSPNENLTPGEHTITITYTDSQGKTQTLTRTFVVSATTQPGMYPAFVATPSATPTARPRATATPRPTVRPTPRPTTIATGSAIRSRMPSTSSGIPTSGVDIPTQFLLLIGAGLIGSGIIWKKRIIGN